MDWFLVDTATDPQHLEFAIKEFREMKMQPSEDRALKLLQI
jgi:hypothetical protein